MCIFRNNSWQLLGFVINKQFLTSIAEIFVKHNSNNKKQNKTKKKKKIHFHYVKRILQPKFRYF